MNNNSKVFFVIIVIIVVLVFVFLTNRNGDEYLKINNTDTDIPGRQCSIIINRATYEYEGSITSFCSAVNCENTTKKVEGKLTEDEYNNIVEQYNKREGSRNNMLCTFFE